MVTRTYELADTEAFLKPVAMIPDIGGPANRFFRVLPRTEWHLPFIAWLDANHNLDEMEVIDKTEVKKKKKRKKGVGVADQIGQW